MVFINDIILIDLLIRCLVYKIIYNLINFDMKYGYINFCFYFEYKLVIKRCGLLKIKKLFEGKLFFDYVFLLVEYEVLCKEVEWLKKYDNVE